MCNFLNKVAKEGLFKRIVGPPKESVCDFGKNTFGETTELTYQIGGHYIHSFDRLWFMPADLTMGIEFNGSNLEDESGYRKNPISQRTKNLGFFLQNEWKTHKWSLLLGGRVDKHNLVKNAIFVLRVNVRYNTIEGINLRASSDFYYKLGNVIP